MQFQANLEFIQVLAVVVDGGGPAVHDPVPGHHPGPGPDVGHRTWKFLKEKLMHNNDS